MPRQITDVDRFIEMSADATECRVRRVKGQVKLKLRTRRYLYTLVTSPQQAESILQRVQCEVKEARPEEGA